MNSLSFTSSPWKRRTRNLRNERLPRSRRCGANEIAAAPPLAREKARRGKPSHVPGDERLRKLQLARDVLLGNVRSGAYVVENRLRVLETLGVAAAGATPKIHLDKRTKDAASGKLAARLHGAPYWVMHGNAADPYKIWPGERVRELLSSARRAYPRHAAILTGAAREKAALSEIARELDGVHVVAGEFDIAGTAAVLAGADCVIAPDTGILHLAAALNRPVVGLYAPTFATLVGPRARSAMAIVIQKPQTCDPCVEKKCPFTPRNCMDQIGPAEVLGALSRQLDAA